MRERMSTCCGSIQNLSPERKTTILEFVETKAREVYDKMPFLPVHDISHTERVIRNTALICKGEEKDPFLPTITAWLHDLGRLQELQAKEGGREISHAKASAEQVPSILAPFSSELGEEAIGMVQEAVACHSSPNAEDDSLLATILKDADRLDGLGAIGLPRVFAFYPERPIYKPGDPFGIGGDTSEEHLRYSDQSSQLDGLIRNMEWFADSRFGLRTNTAIKLGIPKIQLMIDFLCQLADELGVSRGKIGGLSVVQGARKKIRKFESDKEK